jgi:hypothetical protein
LQETAVQINAANLSLTIPASVLHQLGALIPAELQESGTVELEAIQVSGAVADPLIAKAARQSSASITPKGSLLEFKLSIKTKDGKTETLSSFSAPIRISLKAAADTDRTISGIYHVADNGELEYVGGTWQDGELTAEIAQFGKYGIVEYDKSFTDLNAGHWAAAAVRQLVAKHLVDGVSDSEFAPERHVTRAEFTAMLVRMLGLQTGGSTPYPDVADSKWYAQAIAAAAKAGIVNGVDATHFAPDAEIKREEMAVMIVRAYEFATGIKVSTGQSKQAFTDMEASPEWAKQAVAAAHKLGLVNGRREGQFQPEQQTTRAESAKVIVELLAVVMDLK